MLALLVPLALAGSGFATAPARKPSLHPQADVYFQERDRGDVVTEFAMTELQTRAKLYEGRLLEVRGLVSAAAGSDTRTTLLVARSAEGDQVPVVLPPDRRLEDWPFLDVGATVRFLCRAVTSPAGSCSLELVMPVRDAEALLVDRERAAAAAEARRKEEERRRVLEARRRASGTRMASRGIAASAYRSPAWETARGAGGRALDYVTIYADAVRYFNTSLTVPEARRIASAIIENSRAYGLDARLVMAVIAVESNFNQSAVSRAGAMGLGQLMPGTANDLGVGNAFDLRQNLEGSTRLLSTHIQNMSVDGKPTPEALRLALACYNAGAGAVKKHRGIPPYRETQDYVRKITRLYFQMLPDWERREWTRRGWQPA